MIVTVGEVVWDIFPSRRVLGGAPVNVAYHLLALGLEVTVVTRIGSDSLAEETVRCLGAMGVPLAGVQSDPSLPTGRVTVTIGRDNEPHFDIVAPAAWDAIAIEPVLAMVGDSPFALVYGTLAQRDPRSRATIRRLRQQASARFYDVNLRPPFTTADLVFDSLPDTDLVKVNGAELLCLGQWAGIAGSDKKNIAQQLLKQYNITVLAVTEGPEGAWLLGPEGFCEHAGFPTTVADTVGAGDAFFAALIDGILNHRPWSECLARANQRGSYVAGQHGATPPMPSF